MSWGPYEILSVLSGVVLIAVALWPGLGVSGRDRILLLGGGVAIGGYGIFVAAQTSGVWFFSPKVFAIPVIVVAAAIVSARRRRAELGGQAASARPEVEEHAAPSAPPAATPPADVHVDAHVDVAAGGVVCPGCGATLTGRRRFCTRCGAPLQAPTDAVSPDADRTDVPPVASGEDGAPAAAPTSGSARTARRPGPAVIVLGVALVVGVVAGAVALAHRSRPGADVVAAGADPGAAAATTSSASYLDGATLAWTLDAAQLAPGTDGDWGVPWGPSFDEIASNLTHGPVVVGGQWLVEVYLHDGDPSSARLAAVDSVHGTVSWSVPEPNVIDCAGSPDGALAACLLDEGASARLVVLDMSDGSTRAGADLGRRAQTLAADSDGVVVTELVEPDAASSPLAVSAWTWGGEQRWHVDCDAVAAAPDSAAGYLRLEAGMVLLGSEDGEEIRDESDGSFLADAPSTTSVAVLSATHVAVSVGGLTRSAPSLEVTSTEQEWVRAVPAGGSPLLVGGSEDGSLARLDPESGSTLWSAEGQGVEGVVDGPGDAPVLVVDRAAAIGFLDVATGSQDSEVPTSTAGYVLATPGNQVVLVQEVGSGPSFLDALDPQHGTVAWRMTLPSSSWGVAPSPPGSPIAVYETDSSGGTATIGAYVPAQRTPVTVVPAPSDLPSCPDAAQVVAWGTWGSGWVLVCGTDAETPTWFRVEDPAAGSFTSTDVSFDSSGLRYVASGTDGTGWFSLVPATVGMSDPGGTATLLQTAVGSAWSLAQGSAAPGAPAAFGVTAPEHTTADEARYLSEVLQASAAARASLQPAAGDVRDCALGDGGDYSADIATISSVRDNRVQLLAAVRAAPVDLLPGGTALVQDLAQSLDLSRSADEAYLTWAEQVDAGGCAAGSEDQATTYSTQAGVAKRAFVDRWNSTIAPAFGLPTTSREEL